MKSALRRARQSAGETLASLGLEARTLAGYVLALILVIPALAQMTYTVSLNADARGIIGSRDDDAGNAVDIASHSHWYSSNGFYPYGPVYFRLAHMIGAGLAPLSEPGALPENEARSKAMHLGLMLTSVLALFAFAYLLTGAWTTVRWARLGLSVWMLWGLLHATIWQTFLLRAHPDHLLVFAVAGACFSVARAWRLGTPESYRFAAWCWGFALAIKMTLILWLPFLVLTLSLPWRRGRVRELVHFAANAAAVFFLVGFPQNLNLYKILRFLKQQSVFSLPASRESFAEMFSFWSTELGWPLAILVGGAALLSLLRDVSRDPERKGLSDLLPGWRPLALALGPFALLLLQNVVSPHEHYPMPFVGTQLALLAGVLGARRFNDERGLLALLFFSVLVFSIVPAVPESINAALADQLRCRPQAREIQARVNAFRSESKEIYGDPYIPLMSHLSHVSSTWELSAGYLQAGRYDVLVFNWSYASRYLGEVSEYTKRDNPDWQKAVEIYRVFRDQDRAGSEELGFFRRTFRSECGWEIWQRE